MDLSAFPINLTHLEWVAVGLGITNVALLVRRSIWNYPFGILMVSLYFIIFSDARLYGDAGLQVFFFVIQIYGWVRWRAVQAQTGDIVVQWSSARVSAALAATTVLAAIGLSMLMHHFTDAAAPLPDAAIAMLSVTAQLLLVMRRIESWIYWIAVDCLAIWLFTSRDLLPTAGLYVVFLALASLGLWQWLSAYAQQRHSDQRHSNVGPQLEH